MRPGGRAGRSGARPAGGRCRRGPARSGRAPPAIRIFGIASTAAFSDSLRNWRPSSESAAKITTRLSAMRDGAADHPRERGAGGRRGRGARRRRGGPRPRRGRRLRGRGAGSRRSASRPAGRRRAGRSRRSGAAGRSRVLRPAVSRMFEVAKSISGPARRSPPSRRGDPVDEGAAQVSDDLQRPADACCQRALRRTRRDQRRVGAAADRRGARRGRRRRRPSPGSRRVVLGRRHSGSSQS